MKKCRYSIEGKCTNENVACKKCNSIQIEMLGCIPYQNSIILYDDDWNIEVHDVCNSEIE